MDIDRFTEFFTDTITQEWDMTDYHIDDSYTSGLITLSITRARIPDSPLEPYLPEKLNEFQQYLKSWERDLDDDLWIKYVFIFPKHNLKKVEAKIEKEYLPKFQKVLTAQQTWLLITSESEFRRTLMQRLGKTREGGNPDQNDPNKNKN